MTVEWPPRVWMGVIDPSGRKIPLTRMSTPDANAEMTLPDELTLNAESVRRGDHDVIKTLNGSRGAIETPNHLEEDNAEG